MLAGERLEVHAIKGEVAIDGVEVGAAPPGRGGGRHGLSPAFVTRLSPAFVGGVALVLVT
jgi:hypothetical protein